MGLIHDLPTCADLIGRMVAEVVARHRAVAGMLA